ncbi:MAG: YCF48-related protein [Ignavibacteria bacterium]
MKKSIIIILISLLFTVTLSAQSSWIQQTSPLGNEILGKIQFVSASEGWISAGNGKLLHTTNGGNNWTVVNPEPVDTLFSWSDPAQSISFINPSTGWIVRTKGNFNQWNGAVAYKTTNGGNSWTKLSIPVHDAGMYIQFVDANTGWMLLFNTNYTGGGVYKSTNGGSNWFVLSPPIGGLPYFLNTNTGWIFPAGDQITTADTIIKTTNGGLNWIRQWGSNVQVAYNMMSFSDANNGWIVGRNGLVRQTTNGGNTWQNVPIFGMGPANNNKAVFFINANTGWIGTKADGTQNPYVLYTNNGGTSWSWQQIPLTYSIFSINFFDANNGGLTSDYGGICHTTNGGVHVNNLSTEIPSSYSLSQNYPNPFNPSTSIEFDVVQTADVKISVFDIYGKEIDILVNERLQTGRYKTEWNGTKQSSGVYFYRMQSGNFIQSKQMILLK